MRREDDEVTISRSVVVETDEQFLEHGEGADFAVHRESLAQGVPDAGMNRRRRDLHEAPCGSVDHGLSSRIERIHGC